MRWNKTISFIAGMLLAVFPALVWTQENLIVNGDCESMSSCPQSIGQISNCLSWNNFAFVGSADFFDTCSTGSVGIPNNYGGYQQAYNKNGYLGLASLIFHHNGQNIFRWRTSSYGKTEFREAALGALSETLTPGWYQFKCFVNCANGQDPSDKRIFLAAFDLMFLDSVFHPIANTLPYMDTSRLIDLNPSAQIIDDTLNWIPLTICYEARGGEKYFAIGTMRDSLKLTNLTFVGDPTNSDVVPYLAYYYFDSFSLYACDTCCGQQPEEHLAIAGNGTANSPTFQMTLQSGSEADLTLYDCLGKLILYHKFTYGEPSFQLPDSLARAMYHYVVGTTAGFSQTGKVLKM